jgi:anti-anti-sigma factor
MPAGSCNVLSYRADMKVEETGYGFVVHISANLTQKNAAEISATVMAILSESCPETRVVLDFAGAALIDSSGIGAVLELGKKAMSSNICLILCGLPESARRVLNRTGIANFLTIVGSRT